MPAAFRVANPQRRAAAIVKAVTWRSDAGIFINRCELRCLLIRHQRVDQLIERCSLEHLIELVQRQADAMVGDASLRKIVGANALGTVTGSDLILTLRRARISSPLAFLLEQTRAQDLHGK